MRNSPQCSADASAGYVGLLARGLKRVEELAKKHEADTGFDSTLKQARAIVNSTSKQGPRTRLKIALPLYLCAGESGSHKVRCLAAIDLVGYATNIKATHAGKSEITREDFKDRDSIVAQAIGWLLASAQFGNVDAQKALAQIFAMRGFGKRGVTISIFWLEEAVASGSAVSAMKLANSYASGKRVKQNYSLALEYLERASKIGHPEAQYLLGRALREGSLGVVDEKKALSLILESAASLHREARVLAEKLLSTGELSLSAAKKSSWWKSRGVQGDYEDYVYSVFF